MIADVDQPNPIPPASLLGIPDYFQFVRAQLDLVQALTVGWVNALSLVSGSGLGRTPLATHDSVTTSPAGNPSPAGDTGQRSFVRHLPEQSTGEPAAHSEQSPFAPFDLFDEVVTVLLDEDIAASVGSLR